MTAVLGADEVRAAITVGAAADALDAALRRGFPGAPDPARAALHVPTGEMLVMPSAATGVPAVKIVTIRDRGPGPRIQGVHIDIDPETLAVRAVLDAGVLTLIRTTAVSVLALRFLATEEASRLVVVGAGPQAAEHLDAIPREWPIASATVVAPRIEAAHDVVARVAPGHPGLFFEAAGTDSAAARAALADADIVVCATTASTPVVADTDLARDVAVVAIGSHQPDRRELPGELLARAFVAVEDRETAMREAGDVIQAVAERSLDPAGIAADLGEIVRGEVAAPGRGARVFKSVGMAWEDAVVGASIGRG